MMFMGDTSQRMYWFKPTVPTACLPIAHWYVFRGLWLWCGYGMRPETTPRMVTGSSSKCVVRSVISASVSATRHEFSCRVQSSKMLGGASQTVSKIRVRCNGK